MHQDKPKHKRNAHDGLADEGELDLSADLGELLGVVAEDAQVLAVDVRLALFCVFGEWGCSVIE